MATKRPNPFSRFLDADFALNGARRKDGKIEHNITWWAEFLEIEDRSLVSRWYHGNRRIGTHHEPKVFARLERYWADDPRRWSPLRFTPEDYRAAVPTVGQLKAEAKRVARRRRLSRLRKSNLPARHRSAAQRSASLS